MSRSEIGKARPSSSLMGWLVWNVTPQFPVTRSFTQWMYCSGMLRSRYSWCLIASACSGVAPGPVLSATTTLLPPGRKRSAIETRKVTTKSTISSWMNRWNT